MKAGVWALALGGAVAIGCKGSKASDEVRGASKPASAQGETRAEVGYDVRRLRPRDGEPLQEMFERMRERAVKEGKHVAVLFGAGWCEPCRDLELELGNMHPAEAIGDFRILELKEEDWEGATRIGEFNNLRRRWYKALGSYPVFVVLDDQGGKIEEMKEAIARLEGQGLEATVPNWFRNIAEGHGPKASG